MFLYVLDLFGVAVFAASGALAGVGAQFDLLGVLVLASITAVGGGTIRDVLLGRHPVFWIQDSGSIYAILVGAVLTLVWVHFRPVPADALAIADAIGLAMFAISGAQVAEKAGCRALVVVLMGTLTGAGGGVVKVGTKVRGIRLVDGDHDIDCKIPGIGQMGLKSQFVKKVTE